MIRNAANQYDKMTKTPIPRLVMTLSVPAILSMLVTNIYNLVDTAFVGRFGNSASGAVGIVFGFMAIIQAFGFMFGQGAGSILSRALGAKDTHRASLYVTASLFASFGFGLVITAVGFIWLDPIVRFLGSTETIAPYAKTYIFYILIASPFMSSSLTLNNCLRYEGKASLGMIGLMTGAILNMALDPVLMFALDLGIAGAGLSTAVSQVVSWAILLRMFLAGKTSSKIGLRLLAESRPGTYWDLMTTGFPSLLRQGLNSITTVLLNSCCTPYGDEAIAAMSIVSRIVFFAFSIAVGVGQGFQPVAAFNYGAKKFARLRKGYRFAMLAAEGIIILGCSVLAIFAPRLVSLFRDDARVIEIGARALRLQAGATLILPICMMTEMLFQSTGKRLGATLLSSFRSGMLFIPSLLLLARFRGLSGIQEAQPVSLLLSLPLTVPFIIWFFRKIPKTDFPDEAPPGA